ncbi:alpha-ketoglutarate-dependent dioxygenase AlkB family protein [Aureicoccus marinus]|uniref:Alpha-ketoglutarate-dependent dioxygenase AlkB n=1 Tax=Aureicoccus marinus TaxID=754435 RepID=A0A2S7T7I8_9FLAO|nr:alpha-ketoglutarate-dependent dioxygenase AlkB [Aureicoccus marinus]PQJ15541.1 alpha-ketoglutarate-dependent dioxygenase AlkB [Aureicoccus marinus]
MTELSPLEGKIELPQAELDYWPHFLSETEAAELYTQLLLEVPWQSDRIQVFGQWYDQPRLTALYGEEGKPYTYSGITMNPHNFTRELKTLKDRIEKQTGDSFSSCLLNNYRNGSDSNGWHADDEKELGQNPVIASLSLGHPRFFHLRPKNDKKNTYKLLLQPGSLLVMRGRTQHHWQHQLPKSKKVKEGRINLTFRQINHK